MQYYVYILYSKSSDRYYVGQTNDPERRIREHNYGEKNAFTTRYRPWVLVRAFPVGESLGIARKIENHLKRFKSKKLISRITELEDIDDLVQKYSNN